MEPPANPTQAELFKKLFPWPDDVPLPRPRFGKTLPPPPVRLPNAQGEPKVGRLPFCFSWEDKDLALNVYLREQESSEGHAIWVEAESSTPGYLGKSVSVAILGERDNRMRRLTVLLDTPREKGCCGRQRLATLHELSQQLGDLVTVDAFLLE